MPDRHSHHCLSQQRTRSPAVVFSHAHLVASAVHWQVDILSWPLVQCCRLDDTLASRWSSTSDELTHWAGWWCKSCYPHQCRRCFWDPQIRKIRTPIMKAGVRVRAQWYEMSYQEQYIVFISGPCLHHGWKQSIGPTHIFQNGVQGLSLLHTCLHEIDSLLVAEAIPDAITAHNNKLVIWEQCGHGDVWITANNLLRTT